MLRQEHRTPHTATPRAAHVPSCHMQLVDVLVSYSLTFVADEYGVPPGADSPVALRARHTGVNLPAGNNKCGTVHRASSSTRTRAVSPSTQWMTTAPLSLTL